MYQEENELRIMWLQTLSQPISLHLRPIILIQCITKRIQVTEDSVLVGSHAYRTVDFIDYLIDLDTQQKLYITEGDTLHGLCDRLRNDWFSVDEGL